MTRPNALLIHLQSDTAFGRGTGTAGDVDIEVHCTPYGLPFVPGKIIHGLLHDGWGWMAHAFGDLEDAANELFGCEGMLRQEAILRIGDGMLPEVVQQATTWACERKEDRIPPRRILYALTDTRRQTARSRPDRGAPAATTLRSTRVILRDLQFTAPLQWFREPDERHLRVLALVALAVRRAGLNRTRGKGSIRLWLEGDAPAKEDSPQETIEVEQVLRLRQEAAREATSQWAFPPARREEDRPPPPAAPLRLQATRPLQGLLGRISRCIGERIRQVYPFQRGKVEREEPGHTVTRFYRLQLDLSAAAIAGSGSGEPSSSKTVPLLPGALLRGAIGDWVPREDFADLILSGNVNFLNAYPVTSTTRKDRTLPVPAALKANKESGQLFDLTGDEEPESPLDSLDYMAAWPDNRLVQVRVRATMNFHHRRDRRYGRARQGSGAVFAYEGLDAQQTFEGVLAIKGRGNTVGEAGQDAGKRFQRLKAAVQQAKRFGGLILGRSRHAQYGGNARLDLKETPLQRELESSYASQLQTEEIRKDAQDNEFLVLLTSDYIGRDPETGQISPCYFETELKDTLSRLLYGNESQGDAVDITGRWLNYGTAGGYNRYWALPLPMVRTLMAGSVLRLRAKADLPPAILLQAEVTALGERTVDGFGRFAFLHSGLPITLEETTVPPPETPPPPHPDVTLFWLQRQLVEMALEQKIALRAATLAKDCEKPPTRHLIGRLRLSFRQGYGSGLHKLAEWLTDDKAKKRLHEKFGDAQLRNQALFAWFEKLVNNPAEHGVQLETIVNRWRITDPPTPVPFDHEDIAGRLIDSLMVTLQRRAKQR